MLFRSSDLQDTSLREECLLPLQLDPSSPYLSPRDHHSDRRLIRRMAVIAGNPQVRHRPLHPLLSLVMLATLTASMRCTILACTCASNHGVDMRHSVPAEGSTTNSVVGCYPQVDAGSDASSDVLHDVYESPSLRAAQDRAQRMESFLALTQRVRPGGMAGACPCRSARQI